MTSSLALRLAAFLVAAVAGDAAAPASPVHGQVARHGRVVLDNFSTSVGVPAVTFDHSSHRILYTCRACHADVGFAMKAGETQVSATSNEAGLHCGACHDGKSHDGRTVFRSCWGWPRADAARGCTRCHTGPDGGPPRGREALEATLPLDSAGDVDWGAAQRRGLIKPLDVVEGVSPKRAAMKIDRDVTIQAVGTWLKNVTFSHRKHATWNGCELCHPDVFPMSQRKRVKYGMDDVRAGRYCGVCHLNVAFSIEFCERCHGGEARPPLR